jgi:hypothetical protein
VKPQSSNLIEVISPVAEEVTAFTIGYAFQLFHDNPEILDALRKDRSLLPTAVEEMVRMACPIPLSGRTVTKRVRARWPPVRSRRARGADDGIGQSGRRRVSARRSSSPTATPTATWRSDGAFTVASGCTSLGPRSESFSRSGSIVTCLPTTSSVNLMSRWGQVGACSPSRPVSAVTVHESPAVRSGDHLADGPYHRPTLRPENRIRPVGGSPTRVKTGQHGNGPLSGVESGRLRGALRFSSEGPACVF